jgi:hypothetical protein
MLGVILLENGKTDYFYDKVTTPRKKSMILGISKSEQGIIPSVLNEKVKDADFYNFSFALSVSPYGEAYLESIKNKIDDGPKKGMFILSVDPWSVASFREDPDNENKFEETLHLLDETSEYALTGSIISNDRYAINLATKVLENAAGNFYINDKPTGAVVGQQPFGGARGSGTNDKAGAAMNLLRWTSARTIKETFVPPTDYRYPFLG